MTPSHLPPQIAEHTASSITELGIPTSLHSNGLRFARAALAAYVGEAGVAVEEETAGRFHVVSALEHFAFVSWDTAGFAHIIAWATAAARALAPDWVA